MCCLPRNEKCCSGDCDACYPSECCNPVCPSDTKYCCTKIRAFGKVVRHVSAAIFVRLLYIIFASIIFIWKLVLNIGTGALYKPFKWVMLGFTLFILLEMLYTAIRRLGKEWKWFSPSTFVFLLAILPTTWELQLAVACHIPNNTCPADFYRPPNITGSIMDMYNQNAIKYIVLATVFLIMLGKWMAPKGQLTAAEHSSLLITILASGADKVELLELVNGEGDFEFVVVVLFAFTWSLMQLCISTTTVKTLPAIDFKDDKRDSYERASKQYSIPEKNINTMNGVKDMYQTAESNKSYSSIRCNLFFFYNEIWAIWVCLICQDIPFLVIRLFAMINEKNTDGFSITFFAIKNILTIILGLNRMRIIFKKEYRPWKEQCKELRNRELTARRYMASENSGFET